MQFPWRPFAWLLSILLFLSLLPAKAQSQMEDLEKEFFQDVGKMEKEYRDFEKAAFEDFQRSVKAMWNDFMASTKKDWVEYSSDKTGRSKVDFEKGEVVVQVLVPEEVARQNPKAVEERLADEVERLAVDHGKARDYPLPAAAFRDEPIPSRTPDGQVPPPALLPYPVLDDQLVDVGGKPVTESNKKEFAREIVKREPVSREEIRTQKGRMVKAEVKFALVPDHLRVRAEKHLARVQKHSRRFEVDIPLTFAVIHTESYFNPKARSPVPAYGLMQLVPKSGGLDAYRFVHKVERAPSPDYLYDPDNNVELGTAYLCLIRDHYFRAVRDPRSALYCSIAAYNTGAGNVCRALTGTTSLTKGVERVNRMKPDDLYAHLQSNLPYVETRDYLKKVSERMALYEEWR